MTIHTQRSPSQILAALLVWPAALTSATHSTSQARNFGNRWNASRAHQKNVNANPKGSRRQLSSEDQLDILKLGFIPPTKSSDENKAIDAVIRFNRGGNIDDVNIPRSRCRQLSVEDQLDILKLGFIPTCKTTQPNNGMIQCGRGGSMEIRKPQHALHHLMFASIMAFLAGYSDAICFKKFHCYAAMMSGNILMMSCAMVESNWKAVMWRLSLIGGYAIGAAGVRSIEVLHKQKTESKLCSSPPQPNQHLKIAAPIVAALFAIAEKLISARSSTSDGHNWSIAVLALGFGMAYASMNQALNATITQLLTGHVTKLGSAITDRFLGNSRQWNKGSLTSVCIIGSFVIGGACGTQFLRLAPKEFPIFALLGIVYALVLAMF